MDPALEALPTRPLTAQDVATLNDAPALGIIPYSWYGEQVIALLLLYDERRAGEDQQTADAVEQQAVDGHLNAGSEQQQADEAEPEQDEGGESQQDEKAEPRQDEKAEPRQANESDEGHTEDNEADPPERAEPDRTATARDETSSFGSDDSPGVGTVEVIDSGDLTPDEDDDSLAPDLGGESDRTEQVDLTEDETAEDERAEDETAEDDEQSEDPQEGNKVREQDNLDQTETAQEEGEALHVYAVGFDGGVDSWVAIAEIDPDAELTDAEPLFREWATRTYHDQIVDRLAIGPSEYDIDE